MEDQSQQCRICLSNDNLDDMISPCLCSGSAAFVHRTCLNQWRAENINGRGFKSCNVCQFEYVIETVAGDPKAERERLLKYRFFVIRDSLGIFLAAQLIIFLVTLILKWMDKGSQTIKNMFPDLMNEFTAYYISAFVILLAIIGLITVIVFCIASRGEGFGNVSGNGRSGSSSGAGWFIGVVIFFAVMGFVVGIVLLVILMKKIMKHHASKLWLRQEAEKYIVKDFQRRREELEQHRRSPVHS